MARVKEKKNAISLRKQGFSYNEICEQIGVAKSTCSVWLRGIKLNRKAIHRLADREKKGREKAFFYLKKFNEYARMDMKLFIL